MEMPRRCIPLFFFCISGRSRCDYYVEVISPFGPLCMCLLFLCLFFCTILRSRNSLHAGDVDRGEALCECRCTVLSHLQEIIIINSRQSPAEELKRGLCPLGPCRNKSSSVALCNMIAAPWIALRLITGVHVVSVTQLFQSFQ